MDHPSAGLAELRNCGPQRRRYWQNHTGVVMGFLAAISELDLHHPSALWQCLRWLRLPALSR
jgi:hypothetical protein